MDEETSSGSIAYLIFDKANPAIPLDRVNAYLKKEWPNCPLVQEPSEEDGVTTFRFGMAKGAALAPMGGPIPWSELEGLSNAAWWWDGAADAVRGHKDHVLLTVLHDEDDDLVKRNLDVTALLAGLAAASGAVAVISGGGRILHSASNFCALAEAVREEKPQIPLTLWIDFQIFREEDGKHSFFAWGLEDFGLPNMEVQNSTTDADEVFQFLQSVVLYVLGESLVLNDGETIGFSEEHKVSISYGPSLMEEDKQVAILKM